MAAPFALVADGLGYRAGGRWLLREVCLRASPGEVVGLIGPNGAGKSTLARLLAGLLRPASGRAWFEQGGRVLRRSAAARQLAYVAQSVPEAPGFTAGEVVLMGRYPHRGALARETTADREAAARAMGWMGVLELAGRRFDSLSGGERQRVMVARALAQAERMVILDEPTSALDVRHQLELLALLRRLAEEGMGFVVVLHDLAAAGSWCDRLVLLDRGRVAAEGVPREVLREEVLAEVYGIEAAVEWDGEGRCSIAFALAGTRGEAAGVSHVGR
ncbi:MAG: histidinol-phosphatase [Tepidiforma sp.]|nr:MAG: histidinol-phosphatase [Tepidiforma sp.]